VEAWESTATAYWARIAGGLAIMLSGSARSTHRTTALRQARCRAAAAERTTRTTRTALASLGIQRCSLTFGIGFTAAGGHIRALTAAGDLEIMINATRFRFDALVSKDDQNR